MFKKILSLLTILSINTSFACERVFHLEGEPFASSEEAQTAQQPLQPTYSNVSLATTSEDALPTPRVRSNRRLVGSNPSLVGYRPLSTLPEPMRLPPTAIAFPSMDQLMTMETTMGYLFDETVYSRISRKRPNTFDDFFTRSLDRIIENTMTQRPAFLKYKVILMLRSVFNAIVSHNRLCREIHVKYDRESEESLHMNGVDFILLELNYGSMLSQRNQAYMFIPTTRLAVLRELNDQEGCNAEVYRTTLDLANRIYAEQMSNSFMMR